MVKFLVCNNCANDWKGSGSPCVCPDCNKPAYPVNVDDDYNTDSPITRHPVVRLSSKGEMILTAYPA